MIGLLGISHKTASLEIREKYALSNEEILCFADCLQQDTNITHCAILSTCNRTEIYFYCESDSYNSIFDKAYKVLNSYKGVNEHNWHHFYHLSNLDVVGHLFQVASG